jgi:predicted amidohydrolase
MLDLKVALIQVSVFWEDKAANLDHLGSLFMDVEQGTNLIILPEMFNTGFSMKSESLFETMTGETISWMKKKASKLNSVITGSVIIKENGKFYNRLLWVTQTGVMEWYDKRHLFRMGDEHQHFSAGKNRKVFELNGWRLMPQVCYDLRFPVWSRNTINDLGEFVFDVLFYAANWPQRRIHQWDALLKARAIENQSYVLSVNRIGSDPTGIDYPGHSTVIDPLGEQIAFNEREETILYATLSKKALKEYRELFPAWKDADSFSVGLY